MSFSSLSELFSSLDPSIGFVDSKSLKKSNITVPTIYTKQLSLGKNNTSSLTDKVLVWDSQNSSTDLQPIVYSGPLFDSVSGTLQNSTNDPVPIILKSTYLGGIYRLMGKVHLPLITEDVYTLLLDSDFTDNLQDFQFPSTPLTYPVGTVRSFSNYFSTFVLGIDNFIGKNLIFSTGMSPGPSEGPDTYLFDLYFVGNTA